MITTEKPFTSVKSPFNCIPPSPMAIQYTNTSLCDRRCATDANRPSLPPMHFQEYRMIHIHTPSAYFCRPQQSAHLDRQILLSWNCSCCHRCGYQRVIFKSVKRQDALRFKKGSKHQVVVEQPLMLSILPKLAPLPTFVE